jgi:hypothetical protein
MDLYTKVVEYVDTSFQGKQKLHFERTVFWYEKFIPNLTEAHRIAAYSHDIERAFRTAEERKVADYLDPQFLKNHQEKGAEIMSDFLRKENTSEDVIEKVSSLISRHEIGGDEDQNALMDADSISFFETNAELFVNKQHFSGSSDSAKTKLDWMFNRISSKEHKGFARENYEKWSREL